eukprot:403333640
MNFGRKRVMLEPPSHNSNQLLNQRSKSLRWKEDKNSKEKQQFDKPRANQQFKKTFKEDVRSNNHSSVDSRNLNQRQVSQDNLFQDRRNTLASNNRQGARRQLRVFDKSEEKKQSNQPQRCRDFQSINPQEADSISASQKQTIDTFSRKNLHHHKKKQGNLFKQMLEKVSKDKTVLKFQPTMIQTHQPHKKRKRQEFEDSLYDKDLYRQIQMYPFNSENDSDEESTRSQENVNFLGKKNNQQNLPSPYRSSYYPSRVATKKRKLNFKEEVLYLKQINGTQSQGIRGKSKVQKRPFKLFQDRQIFAFTSKDQFKMLEENLIQHEHDDDCDTDEDIVEDHIGMCLEELKTRIDEFLNGSPLKLIRNIRGEFQVFERFECNTDEDVNSSPDSSWYELVSSKNTLTENISLPQTIVSENTPRHNTNPSQLNNQNSMQRGITTRNKNNRNKNKNVRVNQNNNK